MAAGLFAVNSTLRAVLLHGPTGLGKTRGVQLLAADFNVPLVSYDPYSVAVGESAVAAAVALAVAQAPSLLLVDLADLHFPSDPGPVGWT